jgi:hypothetical protein
MTLKEKLAQKAAAPQPTPGKPRGLVLTSKPAPEPKTAPAPDYYEERSLAVPDGQGIDMTPVDASPAVQTWHWAMNSFESELAITNDPEDPTHAWIAVFPTGMAAQPPILLKRIQYIEHPQTKRPANQPF